MTDSNVRVTYKKKQIYTHMEMMRLKLRALRLEALHGIHPLMGAEYENMRHLVMGLQQQLEVFQVLENTCAWVVKELLEAHKPAVQSATHENSYWASRGIYFCNHYENWEALLLDSSLAQV